MMGGRSLWFWFIAPVVLVALGCRGGSFSFNYHDHRPARSAQPVQLAQPAQPVRPVHVCTRACHHHFFDGTKLVVIEGNHHHRAGCGHGWDGHHWVRVYRGPLSPRGHRCTLDCHNHYSDGIKLILIAGHHHGQGCGHLWDGEHWLLVRTGPVVTVRPTPAPVRGIHVCTRGCHEHFHDGSQLMIVPGHHHGAGCGHSWNGQHWVVLGKAKSKRPRPTSPSPRPVKKRRIHPRP
ncbi:MAG: hypothetical protein IIB60_04955 [Planctomycetes bacterium]|nr:hypothetical protein [Planctomycetota bacterium]